MTVLAASMATGIVVLVLAAAAAGHLARPSHLTDAVRGHRVLGAALAPAAAGGAIAAEALLAAGGVTAVLLGHRGALAGVLTGAAALFGCYTLYAWRALASAPAGTPCGCSRTELPVSGWVVGRAALLAGTAAGGAALVAAGAAAPAGPAEHTLTALAAATCALLVWQLPAAAYQPRPFPRVVAVPGGPHPAAGPAHGDGPAGSPTRPRPALEGGIR
ncbi:MauE/DoxX family redox-associated membrane protein [Streptomyces otsuchiensis]|uniref:MauE/DoxX family redox-associated membrane protein n=1 Tax=Streptomyces otsuchiensis TaxID=2681388 RepID=UPI001030C14C|nr:MauE/DoxX family redox-associated membrane protein [Streptomyces otsuchiensis]